MKRQLRHSAKQHQTKLTQFVLGLSLLSNNEYLIRKKKIGGCINGGREAIVCFYLLDLFFRAA